MKFLKKAWKFLNGNKTIICSFVWLLVSKGLIPISPEWSEVLEYVLMSATGGSLVHHIKKGYLKADK